MAATKQPLNLCVCQLGQAGREHAIQCISQSGSRRRAMHCQDTHLWLVDGCLMCQATHLWLLQGYRLHLPDSKAWHGITSQVEKYPLTSHIYCGLESSLGASSGVCQQLNRGQQKNWLQNILLLTQNLPALPQLHHLLVHCQAWCLCGILFSYYVRNLLLW